MDDLSHKNRSDSTHISLELSVVKKKDFNATLKQLTDGLERMCSGNRLHSDGAATANERAPNFVAVLGMTRSSRVADRSLRLA